MIWGMTGLLGDVDRFRRPAYETLQIVRTSPFPVEGDAPPVPSSSNHAAARMGGYGT